MRQDKALRLQFGTQKGPHLLGLAPAQSLYITKALKVVHNVKG